MGKQDEKLISKIEQKPIRTDITFDELQRYYELHGFFTRKQSSGTSHFHFTNGIQTVTVPKHNPVKPYLIKQAIHAVHDCEEENHGF